jgi:hypothetical protein
MPRPRLDAYTPDLHIVPISACSCSQPCFCLSLPGGELNNSAHLLFPSCLLLSIVLPKRHMLSIFHAYCHKGISAAESMHSCRTRLNSDHQETFYAWDCSVTLVVATTILTLEKKQLYLQKDMHVILAFSVTLVVIYMYLRVYVQMQGIFACSVTLVVAGGATKLGYTQALQNVMAYVSQFLPEFTSQLQEAAVYAPATVINVLLVCTYACTCICACVQKSARFFHECVCRKNIRINFPLTFVHTCTHVHCCMWAHHHTTCKLACIHASKHAYMPASMHAYM